MSSKLVKQISKFLTEQSDTMPPELNIEVSWGFHEVSSKPLEIDRDKQDRFTAMYMKLDRLIVKQLRDVFSAVRVYGPEAGTYDDTYCILSATDIPKASKVILDYWGDSNGGDLLINGMMSGEIEELVYKLETAYGVSEYDEPNLMFRITMDNVEIHKAGTEAGQTLVARFDPKRDDYDDFKEIVEEFY